MKFDNAFDQAKSEWTKKVRGIDFVEARKVWDDLEAITGPADTKDGEIRWLRVGQIEGKLWAVFYTIRPEGVRIFSVRPARKDEKDAYNE